MPNHHQKGKGKRITPRQPTQGSPFTQKFKEQYAKHHKQAADTQDKLDAAVQQDKSTLDKPTALPNPPPATCSISLGQLINRPQPPPDSNSSLPSTDYFQPQNQSNISRQQLSSMPPPSNRSDLPSISGVQHQISHGYTQLGSEPLYHSYPAQNQILRPQQRSNRQSLPNGIPAQPSIAYSESSYDFEKSSRQELIERLLMVEAELRESRKTEVEVRKERDAYRKENGYLPYDLKVFTQIVTELREDIWKLKEQAAYRNQIAQELRDIKLSRT